MQKDTSWNSVAGWYNKLLEESPETYQSQVILPNLLRLVDPQPNETIADIACGQGFFSRALAGAGAKVIGIDVSKNLIAIAKKKSPANVEYLACPADDMRHMRDHLVDKAVIVLAIQNIENLAGVIKETARILKSNGRLSIVMNHPAFRVPEASSWGWDPETKTQYRRLDGYMSESRAKIDMHPSTSRYTNHDTQPTFTISFHRPLQVYMKALAKNGFAVTHLEEWTSHKKSQPGPRAKAEDRARKEFPLFLYLEARRPVYPDERA